MDKPLSDPILEAAAHILAPWLLTDGDVDVMRGRLSPGAFQDDLDRARAAVEEAARQIDSLRAAGGCPRTRRRAGGAANWTGCRSKCSTRRECQS